MKSPRKEQGPGTCTCFSDRCSEVSGREPLTSDCGHRGSFPERLIGIINDDDEEGSAAKTHN